MERIPYLLSIVQLSLFPALREEIGDLTENERQLALMLEALDIEKHISRFPTTEALIDRLQRGRVLRRLCDLFAELITLTDHTNGKKQNILQEAQGIIFRV